MNLLSRIEHEAIDGDLAKALRSCLSLGGATGSEELRSWASLELGGYRDQDLPEYRVVYAPLVIDGMTMNAQVRGQAVSTFQLPDFARGKLDEEVHLTHSIPALQDLVKSTSKSDGPIRLSPPGSQEVVLAMNNDGGHNGYVERLYWSLSPTSVVEVLEAVRTKLVALVAEMRAGMGSGDQLPSPEIASQAFGVAIVGDNNRVKVSRSQTISTDTEPRKTVVRRSIEVAAALATIAAFVWAVAVGWPALFG